MARFSAPDARVDLQPVDASSVVLLRPGPVRPEVFLLQRHGRSAFMGGAFVFPGGKIDPEDAHPELLARARFSADVDRQEPSPGRTWRDNEARAALVAAIRELFEEAGVLLARPRGETGWVSPTGEWARYRAALDEGTRSFRSVLEAETLELAADALVYVDHWITPSAERRRFDARFFLASLPPGQDASSDARETTEGRWWTAEAALRAHARGEVFVPPPTLRILEMVGEARSVEDARLQGRDRIVRPLLPRLGDDGGRITIHLPWSPRYPELPGEGCEVPDDASARRWAPTIVVPAPDDLEPVPSVPEPALEILHFWFGPDLERSHAPSEVSARWWAKDPAHDEAIRRRFGATREAARAGALDHWSETPEGALALVILLDQMSRNLFRGSPRAFEADGQALALAEAAIARGDDQRVSPMCRAFFYLPAMHAEDRDRQAACRLAFERLVRVVPEMAGHLEAADAHQAIVARFGRFPHRNEVLGRASTSEEAEWLASGDRGF